MCKTAATKIAHISIKFSAVGNTTFVNKFHTLAMIRIKKPLQTLESRKHKTIAMKTNCFHWEGNLNQYYHTCKASLPNLKHQKVVVKRYKQELGKVYATPCSPIPRGIRFKNHLQMYKICKPHMSTKRNMEAKRNMHKPDISTWKICSSWSERERERWKKRK